jgi:hypothetical protein
MAARDRGQLHHAQVQRRMTNNKSKRSFFWEGFIEIAYHTSNLHDSMQSWWTHVCLPHLKDYPWWGLHLCLSTLVHKRSIDLTIHNIKTKILDDRVPLIPTMNHYPLF